MTTAADLLGALVLEDGTTWAERAEPWQLGDAAAVLAEVPQPNPKARQGPVRELPRWSYWLRGRGMSKTTDAAAVLLCLLLVLAPRRSRSYVYAVDERQAGLLLDALVGLAERSGLLGALEFTARSVTVKTTDATLSIESSDSASAFGTKPWLVVVDEFALWGDTENYRRLWASIISGLGKVPGSRLLVLSSAGSPGSLAHRVWLSAQDSDHWRTSLTPGPSPWWSESDIEATHHDLLPAEWRRLILCEWAAADDALTTANDVAACTGSHVVLEPIQGQRYTLALDIGTRRDATVLVVGHLDRGPAGRRVVIDKLLRWTGSRDDPVSLSEVEEAIIATSRLYNRARLQYDPYQAAQLTERLKHAGVSCREFTFSTASINRLARTLFGALRDRAIVLPDDPDLAAELAAVRLVETGPGLVRLDHRSGEHDDQAVCCAIVAATLLDQPCGTARLLIPQGDIPKVRLIPARSQPDQESPPTVIRQGQQQDRPGAEILRSPALMGRYRRFYSPPGSWR